MLEREHFEVDRDAGKSQVTSKHESELQVQRFALPALGRGRRSRPIRKMLRSRKLLGVCARPTGGPQRQVVCTLC